VKSRFLAAIALLSAAAWSQAEQEPLPAFEVASVRVTPPAQIGYTSVSPYGGNRFTVTNATLQLLVQIAYGTPYEQMSGIDKLGSERYDVTAKAEDGVVLTYEQVKPRMRRLLEERFQLKIHHEQKTTDGYALVAAKGGPKLQPGTKTTRQNQIYPGGLRLSNAPVGLLAGMLRGPAGRPVMDKTGIEGNYDFQLSYAREEETESRLPSIFTALQEQYGLKLEPAKVPLEILVIDRVEKIPAEN
jgi:uncharacterized protein (TIGR03435 family)